MKVGDKVKYVGKDPRYAGVPGVVSKIDTVDNYIEVQVFQGTQINALWFSPEMFLSEWRIRDLGVSCPVVLSRWFKETEKYIGGSND